MKHKVFVSFHHDNDQSYKDALVSWAEKNDVFIDCSVDLGEIPENWDSQKIREYIRDEHLKDTTVTVLLVGTDTKNRKHIDWELFSSMYDGKKNKKSGILIVNLPSVNCSYHTLCSAEEKKSILPNEENWITIDRAEFERRYPYMPPRIIDNLLKSGVNISVVNWEDLSVEKMKLLLDKAYSSRVSNNYDMSRPMLKRNLK